MKRFDLLFFKLFIGVERAHSEMWEEEIIFSCWYFFSGKLQKKKKNPCIVAENTIKQKKKKKKETKNALFLKETNKIKPTSFLLFLFTSKKVTCDVCASKSLYQSRIQFNRQ